MIEEIGLEVGKNFKVGVSVNGNVMTIDTPKYRGLQGNEDKIDQVEELTKNIVDFIRKDKRVFDVVTHITYEQVRVSFVG